MYEPKYRLNRRDDARWRELLTRHCLEAPVKTGYQRRLVRKYPSLAPAEAREFEQLSRKRSRKIAAHPRVRESIQWQRRQMRRAKRLLARLEKLIKNKVDK
jgi:hypothetical protein